MSVSWRSLVKWEAPCQITGDSPLLDGRSLSTARWEDALPCAIISCYFISQLHCIATALQLHCAHSPHEKADLMPGVFDAGDQSLPTYIAQSINCHGNDLVRWFHKFHRNHCMPRCTHKLYHHKHNCAGTIANSVQLELWLCPLLCPLWQVNMFCNKVCKAQ